MNIHHGDTYPYRVLIVDDEALHRALEKEILDSPKYAVVEAASGGEALEILRRQPFDVVLMDKRMPGIDGDETTRRIRADLNDAMLPVIMVTGSTSTADLEASLHAGASDFVRKPYNPIELVARVDAAAARKRLTDQLDSAESVLFALARMVEAKDGTTGDHCTRLSHNSVVFGEALGLSTEELEALRRGGVLHDIGKLGIPDSILLKPAALTEQEWQIMRQHTTIGARLVDGLKSMRLTAPIVHFHHERWDGSGYPIGLRGEEIPLLARVFQIVDIHDALAHRRPYKKALEQDEIIYILRQEVDKGWRQPELVQAFIQLLRNRGEELLLWKESDDLGRKLYSDIEKAGCWGGAHGMADGST